MMGLNCEVESARIRCSINGCYSIWHNSYQNVVSKLLSSILTAK